jgi:hypothetical protein
LKIDSYSFSKVVVEGKTFTRDLIIFPEKISENWWRASGHSLCEADLAEILAYKPEVLIIGRGAMGLMKIPEIVKSLLAEKGIELIAERSKKACEIFNRMQDRRAVLGLHLTC